MRDNYYVMFMTYDDASLTVEQINDYCDALGTTRIPMYIFKSTEHPHWCIEAVYRNDDFKLEQIINEM